MASLVVPAVLLSSLVQYMSSSFSLTDGRIVFFSIGKHTIFGRVCRGMEIIKRLGSVQTDNTDRYTFVNSKALTLKNSFF